MIKIKKNVYGLNVPIKQRKLSELNNKRKGETKLHAVYKDHTQNEDMTEFESMGKHMLH